MLEKIEKEDGEKTNTFRESLKVGQGIMYDFDINTAIINNRTIEQDERIQE